VKTIRWYSDQGIVPPAGRSAAGYRLYDSEALARLELPDDPGDASGGGGVVVGGIGRRGSSNSGLGWRPGGVVG
jgi:hypothetical protein